MCLFVYLSCLSLVSQGPHTSNDTQYIYTSAHRHKQTEILWLLLSLSSELEFCTRYIYRRYTVYIRHHKYITHIYIYMITSQLPHIHAGRTYKRVHSHKHYTGDPTRAHTNTFPLFNSQNRSLCLLSFSLSVFLSSFSLPHLSVSVSVSVSLLDFPIPFSLQSSFSLSLL